MWRPAYKGVQNPIPIERMINPRTGKRFQPRTIAVGLTSEKSKMQLFCLEIQHKETPMGTQTTAKTRLRFEICEHFGLILYRAMLRVRNPCAAPRQRQQNKKISRHRAAPAPLNFAKFRTLAMMSIKGDEAVSTHF